MFVFYRSIPHRLSRGSSSTSTPSLAASSSSLSRRTLTTIPFVRRTTFVLLSLAALTPTKRSFVYSVSSNPSATPSSSYSSSIFSSMSRFSRMGNSQSSPLAALEQTPADPKIVKSPSEWKKQLTPLAYEVTRESGTERAFTGIYTDTTEPGVYRCACCGTELFTSEDKFHSGCGWPAFSLPIDGLKGDKIRYIRDTSHGMERIETRCKHCEAHLGHVFDDGPMSKGGLRYCINSVSLQFDKKTIVAKNNTSNSSSSSTTATVSGNGTATTNDGSK